MNSIYHVGRKAMVVAMTSIALLCTETSFAQSQMKVDRTKYVDYTPSGTKMEVGDMAAVKAAAVGRPDHVDNSQTKYFPPVVDQGKYGCCGASGYVGHNLNYDYNAYYDLDASLQENQFPVFWTYLMAYQHSDETEVIMRNGVPNIVDYGGRMWSSAIGPRDIDIDDKLRKDPEKWERDYRVGRMQGYEKYYHAMFHRTEGRFYFSAITEEYGREALKNWLWNHCGDTDYKSGGMACVGIAIDGIDVKQIPYTANNKSLGVNGKYYANGFGKSIDHNVTIVGYDDRIEFDLNDDGKYDADEKGAWIICNSYGPDWRNKGRIYLPYKRSYSVGTNQEAMTPGFWRLRKNYEPLRVLRIKMDYSRRSELQLTAGLASDVNASVPEKTQVMSMFNYDGHPLDDYYDPNDCDNVIEPEVPMLGYYYDTPNTAPMEFGFDVTDLSDLVDKSGSIKYFLKAKTKGNAIGSGKIYEFQLYDYSEDRNNPKIYTSNDLASAMSVKNHGGEVYVTVTVPGNGAKATTLEASASQLTWEKPSASMALTGYTIYKNGKEYKTVGASSTNVNIAEGEQQAYYQIVANYTDGSGNVVKSSKSDPVCPILNRNTTEVSLSCDLDVVFLGIIKDAALNGRLKTLDLGKATIIESSDLRPGGLVSNANTIPNDFVKGAAITKLILPESITSIGDMAFSNCKQLTSVCIPDNVKSVGYDAFASCSKLVSATIGNSVTTLSQGVFYATGVKNVYCKAMVPPSHKAYTFGSSNPTIHVYESVEEAYKNAGWSTGVSDNMGVIVGDLDQFVKAPTIDTDCAKLMGNGPSSTFIRERYNVYRNGQLDGSVKTIEALYNYDLGDYAQNDYFQTSVTYTNGLTSEKSEIIFPIISKTTADVALECDIDATFLDYIRKMVNEHQLSSLDLGKATIVEGESLYGDGFTTQDNKINGNLFFFNKDKVNDNEKPSTKLKSIILPESITEIGENAFAYSYGLNSVVIPDNVKTIGQDAFAYCKNLDEVTIGKSVSDCKQGVFWGSPVSTVYSYRMTPPSHLSYLFSCDESHTPCKKRVIHVYKDALQSYLDAKWQFDESTNINGYGTLVDDMDKLFPVRPLLTLVEVVTNASDDVKAVSTDNMRGTKQTLENLKVVYDNKVKITYRVKNEGLPYTGNVDWAHYFKNEAGNGNWGGAGKVQEFPRNEIVDIVEECSGNADGWAGAYINIKDADKNDMLESDVELNIGGSKTKNGVMVYLAGPKKVDGIEYTSDGENGNNLIVTSIDATADNIDIPETITLSTTDLNVTGMNCTPTLTANQLMFMPKAVYDSYGMKNKNNIVVKDGEEMKCNNLVITDGVAFKTEYGFTAEKATYSRNDFDSKWSTICLPFTVAVPLGYEAMEYDGAQNINGEANFIPVNTLEAGKAYMVRKNATAQNTITGSNTFVVKDAVAGSSAIEFIGVFDNLTFNAEEVDLDQYTYYGLVSTYDAFVKAGTSSYCSPFRAYLRMEKTSNAPQYIDILIDGQATGIHSIESINGDDSSPVYNLAGQRINKPQKGIYIKNGKKIAR